MVARAAKAGADLKARLQETFAQHPRVAQVRGKGLLLALEVVADRADLGRFPAAAQITSRIAAEALQRGVAFYPGGTGVVRDVVVIGPAIHHRRYGANAHRRNLGLGHRRRH